MTVRSMLAGVAAGAALAAAAPAMADDYLYASYLPPSHVLHVLGLKPMFEQVKEATGGSVTWRLAPAGQLLGAKNTLSGVGKGIAQAGVVIPSYTARDLPHIMVINGLQMFGEDPRVVNAAADETVLLNCPGCIEDYKENGTVFLAGYTTTAYNLMCNTEVETVADVQGLKLRTTGAVGRWAKAMRGVPVSMTSGDMVEAIQRGTIDCIVGPVAWLKSYSMFDSVKYILRYPMGLYRLVGLFVMNRDAWEKLSADEKKAMIRALPGAVRRTTVDGYMTDDEKALAKAKELGIVVHEGGEDFAKLLESHRKHELEEVAERSRKRGVDDPEKLIETHLALLDKWKKIVAEIGDDADAYQKALWDNIYSKLDPEKL